jgi:simple sugar transport system ATP-binding protein
MQTVPQLAVHHVTKTYSGVVALNDVSLAVNPGEIHAVIGENGAGKSTLMHIIAGVQRPDSGRMEICGAPFAPADERAAQKEGVAIVFQEGSLFAPLSIAENIFAGSLQTSSVL